MAKFDASLVEMLEFDFTQWGGGSGVIDEPSTGDVNRFFKQMRSMMKDVKALQTGADDINVEDLSDEQVSSMMEEMEDKEAGASEAQQKSMEFIAELCGAERDDEGNIVPNSGAPSMEDLSVLPFRVLQIFTRWLMDELKPKRVAPAGKR